MFHNQSQVPTTKTEQGDPSDLAQVYPPAPLDYLASVMVRGLVRRDLIYHFAQSSPLKVGVLMSS